MWQLTLIANEQIEWLSDFLTEQGALAVTLQDAGEQPLFQEFLQETPLWNNTQIQGLFAEHEQALAAIKKLPKDLPIVDLQIEAIADQNWVEKTQNQFTPRCFANRLWIIPPWYDQVETHSPTILRLQPGLGFGTGAHPTTALCLDWLAEQQLAGKSIIDYGCGSGILGLAALALGAERVWAIDHDPQALQATINNAQLNNFNDQRLQPIFPEQLVAVKADIILANILANPLCELAPRLIQYLSSGGVIVLSGFLTAEGERVRAAYQPPLQSLSMDTQEDWIRLVLLKE